MEAVEILLATYNGEKYIKEQLDSILNQDYENWIISACDDASKDSTYEILSEYAKKYPGRFRIQKNEKGFGSAKLNFMHLIQKSTGKYVMCCDQDDVWLPNKISLTLEEMKRSEAENKPVLVHTDLKVVDGMLNVKSDSFFEYSKFNRFPSYQQLLIQNSVTGCTMMMNRPLVELLKQELDMSKILMHDWVAALVACANGSIGFVNCPTMLYRQHGVNSVGAKKYGFSLFLAKLRNSDLRKSLEDTALQAGEIARVYAGKMDEELHQLTAEYAALFEKRKVKRVRFYCKNKIFKKGFARKVCQILFG